MLEAWAGTMQRESVQLRDLCYKSLDPATKARFPRLSFGQLFALLVDPR